MSALWNGGARLAREEIAKHVRKITLKPVFRTYVNRLAGPGGFGPRREGSLGQQ